MCPDSPELRAPRGGVHEGKQHANPEDEHEEAHCDRALPRHPHAPVRRQAAAAPPGAAGRLITFYVNLTVVQGVMPKVAF